VAIVPRSEPRQQSTSKPLFPAPVGRRRSGRDGQRSLESLPACRQVVLVRALGIPGGITRRACRRSGRAIHQASGGKVRELRFHLLAQQPIVTYWLAPGGRVILLTVFRKTRRAEAAEVTRALQAQKTCEAEQGAAHESFDREVS
jgi:hypothetical protein